MVGKLNEEKSEPELYIAISSLEDDEGEMVEVKEVSWDKIISTVGGKVIGITHKMFEEAISGLAKSAKNIAEIFNKELGENKPVETEIKFDIAVTAKGKIIIADGSMESSMTIRLLWK